jgi:hypothetical protein
MTHEELLEKLADIAHNKDAHDARNDYLLALRAVVELHQPVWTFPEGSNMQRDLCCLQCRDGGFVSRLSLYYYSGY